MIDNKELFFAAQDVLNITGIIDSYHCESGELFEAAKQLIAAYRILGYTDESITDVFKKLLAMKNNQGGERPRDEDYG